MNSETDFIEIQDLKGIQRFVNKLHIVDFYLDPSDNVGCITTVLGIGNMLTINKEEYEKFCKKMSVNNPKARKIQNPLLTS
ncbi:MAG: hypothetical protein ICV78_03745 [Tolypothrix sp. Co-bin9]|nr:hypothetical protein [Tolypothrix sp. Co-bin9]